MVRTPSPEVGSKEINFINLKNDFLWICIGVLYRPSLIIKILVPVPRTKGSWKNLRTKNFSFIILARMAQTRQLAAIMFTDIVGYTALMGDDEKKAFDLLRKNRDLQKPLISQFNGKWIKELGDGVLASFQTVTDAVACAMKIQQACASIAGLKLRIGIHLGEVVFEDDDVFGDGVNIASRLQALAPIGGIYISESVFRNIDNQKDMETEFVKEEILKNVKHPVKIYQLKKQVCIQGLLMAQVMVQNRLPGKSQPKNPLQCCLL